jgi:hypothetical protein
MYVQQSFVVEYVVQNNQCPICERREAKDTWNAACQLRQHVTNTSLSNRQLKFHCFTVSVEFVFLFPFNLGFSRFMLPLPSSPFPFQVVHKRTFFYLEQLILRHNAHVNCSNIVERRDGLDFFFQTAVRKPNRPDTAPIRSLPNLAHSSDLARATASDLWSLCSPWSQQAAPVPRN